MSIIIEDGMNTSYISSILVALYYIKVNQFEQILECYPISTNFLYLQSLIKIKFVNELRENKCIFSESLNEIRNYMILECGWGGDKPFDDKNVIDFYNFLTQFTSVQQYSIILNIESDCNNANYINDINCLSDSVLIYIINRLNESKLDIRNIINDKWICQSIICKDDNHYYTIIRNGKEWFRFSDRDVPSIISINLKDYEDDIKRQCVMIIYRPIKN